MRQLLECGSPLPLCDDPAKSLAPLSSFSPVRNGWRHVEIKWKHATMRSPLRRFHPSTFSKTMSQHRSLKGASTIAAKRNVLKRFERVDLMKKRGQWKETSKVIGLPKTKPDV
jgi:small basic protein (TIGR04137 family)